MRELSSKSTGSMAGAQVWYRRMSQYLLAPPNARTRTRTGSARSGPHLAAGYGVPLYGVPLSVHGDPPGRQPRLHRDRLPAADLASFGFMAMANLVVLFTQFLAGMGLGPC
jgi:hypothetical protein